MKDIISIAIAVVSLIFSVYVFIRNKSFEERQKKIEILEPIYIDQLLIKIPSAFSRLNFKSKEDTGATEFNYVIQETRRKVKFMQLLDKDVHSKWIKQLTNIEDFVTNKANITAKNPLDKEQADVILDDLSKLLTNLYKEILSEDFKDIM